MIPEIFAVENNRASVYSQASSLCLDYLRLRAGRTAVSGVPAVGGLEGIAAAGERRCLANCLVAGAHPGQGLACAAGDGVTIRGKCHTPPPLVGVTVAVMVTVSPEVDGFGEDASAVFVGIRSTTWSSLPVDPKQLSSPL